MRLRLLRLLPAAAAFAALAAAGAESGSPQPLFGNIPFEDFSTTAFSPEGYRKMALKGTEARQLTADQTEFIDVNIAVFSGDASTRLNMVILSPSAAFYRSELLASGDGAVRLIDYEHDFEVTGEKWIYDYNRKKISIARNVKVIIHAPLPDILK
jgi:hypothetical protein